MKQSEQARREAIVDQEKKEQQLVEGVQPDGHWPDGQHAPQKDQGFDRSHEGAPRADDRSKYSGQSAYGSLEAADDSAVLTEEHRDAATARGGVSSYGNNLGSRYALDQERSMSQENAAVPLSRAGAAPGAAPKSTNIGQYAGEYDDTPGKQAPVAVTDSVEPQAAPAGRPSEADSNLVPGELRGDEQLKEEIHQRLIEHPDLDIHDLSISMRDGHATLEGSVPDAHMKKVIVELIDNVNGVLKIDERILVQHVNPANHATAQAYAAGADVSDDRQQSGPMTFGAASAKASAMKQQQGEKSESAPGQGIAKDGKS
jgi:osmotically-inducible protein OsmY